MTTVAFERIVVPCRPAKEQLLEAKGDGEMDSEEALIAGFLSGKPALEAEFIKEMQRLLRAEALSNFPSLLPHLKDLEQSATLKLCEMRSEAKRIRPPLRELAKFVVAAPAKALKRVKKTEPLKHYEAMDPADTEKAFELKRLLEISAALPGSLGNTIRAQVAYEMGDGAPLLEALGIDRRSADLRLARARVAVMRIARGEIVGEAEAQDE